MELGCDVIQGYMIGRPVTEDALTDWLMHWERAMADAPVIGPSRSLPGDTPGDVRILQGAATRPADVGDLAADGSGRPGVEGPGQGRKRNGRRYGDRFSCVFGLPVAPLGLEPRLS